MFEVHYLTPMGEKKIAAHPTFKKLNKVSKAVTLGCQCLFLLRDEAHKQQLFIEVCD